MAYFTARQRTDGRWDYTCANGAGLFPIGYCAGPDLAKYSKNEANKSLYHSDGHATADEACDCHRRHELDQETQFHEHPDEQKKCQVCGAWTLRCAFVGDGFPRKFELCDEHLNRESLEKLYLASEPTRAP